MIKKDKHQHEYEKEDQAFDRPFDEPQVIWTALLDIQACGVSRNKPKDIGDQEQKRIFRTAIPWYPPQRIQQQQLNKVEHGKVCAGEREPEKAGITTVHGNKVLDVRRL
jgi:hypothetical protein